MDIQVICTWMVKLEAIVYVCECLWCARGGEHHKIAANSNMNKQTKLKRKIWNGIERMREIDWSAYATVKYFPTVTYCTAAAAAVHLVQGVITLD